MRRSARLPSSAGADEPPTSCKEAARALPTSGSTSVVEAVEIAPGAAAGPWWCMHEDCLEAIEPFGSAEELAAHVSSVSATLNTPRHPS